MNILNIAIRNIKGNKVKSIIIFLCVLAITAFFATTTLITGGAQNSLEQGMQRLGADILVVPEGSESKIETALLMGKPTKAWMPEENLARVRNIEGVAKASPQVYLQSLFGAHCCAVSEMFMVVFDPATDFSITPWLQENLGRNLSRGEVIGGHYVFLPEGDQYIMLYGYNLDLKGTLEPTGTGIDQTMFMTKETALETARWSTRTAQLPLDVPAGNISSVLVKVNDGANPHEVAVRITRDIPGVSAIESLNLFGTFRKQMLGLLGIFIVMLALAYVTSALLISLVFSMSAHERRREMAVLRANGATKRFIFGTLWTEAAIIAIAGSITGMFLSAGMLYMFKDYLSGTLSMPFLYPSTASLIGLAGLTITLSIVTVTIAIGLPAYRISRQEPAIAMKE